MKNNFKFLILLTILLAGCICVGSTFAADASVSDVSDVSSVDNTVINELVHDDSSQKDVEILTNASDIPLNENPNINISVSCSKYSMGNNLYYKVSINDTSYTDDFQTLTRHDSEGFYVYSANWIGTKRINTVGNYKATINIYKLESNLGVNLNFIVLYLLKM